MYDQSHLYGFSDIKYRNKAHKMELSFLQKLITTYNLEETVKLNLGHPCATLHTNESSFELSSVLRL